MKDRFESPLSGRYASEAMLKLFSEQEKIVLWRKLWLSLARAQKALGLPVTEEQVEELAAHVSDVNFEEAEAREKVVRHDVMAHIYAYGLQCPKAAGIIHLGATSQYVKDNADLVIYREALGLIREALLRVVRNLSDFADRYKGLPCLGYTHFQPAQPVTVGKRAALWIQDFMSDLREINYVRSELLFLGCRGTTGTEASFMELFNGDEAKIDEMNRMIAADFGFDTCFPVASQVYPRKLDSRILNVLSSIGESAGRMASDIRLLQHEREVEEPFEKEQIGSSAMPYKRNPMRCERISALSRYLMTGRLNASMTASSQWLERTLDDSAIRRISMPEAFLTADAVLRVSENVTAGLVVNEKIVRKHLLDYLPFLATENILMESVKRGGDRQKLHEIIRECSMQATARMKEGEEAGLLQALSEHPEFGLSKEEFEELLAPEAYIGRCAEQTAEYLREIAPYLQDIKGGDGSLSI